MNRNLTETANTEQPTGQLTRLERLLAPIETAIRKRQDFQTAYKFIPINYSLVPSDHDVTLPDQFTNADRRTIIQAICDGVGFEMYGRTYIPSQLGDQSEKYAA